VTPTWAVILVGLGAAVLGSLLTTLLTISHERAAEFRSHMLNAADDFSTATIAARQQCRNAAGEVRRTVGPLDDPATGWFKEEIKTLLDSANDAVDAVFAKQARVHLLFGDEVPASIAAAGATSHLQRMMGALEHRPDSIRDHAALLTYSRNFEGSGAAREVQPRPSGSASTDLVGSPQGALAAAAPIEKNGHGLSRGGSHGADPRADLSASNLPICRAVRFLPGA
jgi:hypothetical protein